MMMMIKLSLLSVTLLSDSWTRIEN